MDREVGAEPTISAIAETALYVSNVRRSSRFYEEVLGLEPVHQADRGCVFHVETGRVLLVLHETAAQAPLETEGGTIPAVSGPGELPRATTHVAFEVSASDLNAWRTRLEESSVEVESRVAWEGKIESLYFRDPEGNLLELVTPGLWERP